MIEAPPLVAELVDLLQPCSVHMYVPGAGLGLYTADTPSPPQVRETLLAPVLVQALPLPVPPPPLPLPVPVLVLLVRLPPRGAVRGQVARVE